MYISFWILQRRADDMSSVHKPTAGLKYHKTENVKYHNYTWHSADQSTIQEVLEYLRSTMKKTENTGLKITKMKAFVPSQWDILALCLSPIYEAICLCPLITLLQAAVSHHWGVHTTRVNEHVRTDPRQALSIEEGGRNSSPFGRSEGWRHAPLLVFCYFSVCIPCAWGARLLAHAGICMCVQMCVCGCVKRMWRRTQKGLLIIHSTIHSLPEPPGSTLPPTHGRPFNTRLKHINESFTY